MKDVIPSHARAVGTMAGAAAAALLLVVVSSAPARAKLPPFDMDVSAHVVQAGARVTVTVTMLDPQDPSRPLPSFTADDMTGLVGILPAAEVDHTGRPALRARRAQLVHLPRAGAGVFRGTAVVSATPGSFVILPFPQVHMALPDGATGAYADPVAVTVMARTASDRGAAHTCAVASR